jgi:hypothetical protein
METIAEIAKDSPRNERPLNRDRHPQGMHRISRGRLIRIGEMLV